MKRLFAGKQQTAAPASREGDASRDTSSYRDYSDAMPREARMEETHGDSQHRSQQSRPLSTRAPYERQQGSVGKGQADRGYPSYADEGGFAQQHHAFPDLGHREYQASQWSAQQFSQGRSNGHRRDASFGEASHPHAYHRSRQLNVASARNGTADLSHPSVDHSPYMQPQRSHRQPQDNEYKDQSFLTGHADGVHVDSLRRSNSRKHVESTRGAAGLSHYQQERSRSAIPLRRQSTGESTRADEALLYRSNDVEQLPQRQMSLSYSRNSRNDHGVARHSGTTGDAQAGAGQKGSSQDRMRRLVFGQRRGKGPQVAARKPVLDSDEEASGDESFRRNSAKSGGGPLANSWEYVESAHSSTQDMTLGNGANAASKNEGYAKKVSDTKGKHWSNLRGKMRASTPDRRPPDESVPEQIHHLVAMDEYLWEKEQIQSLCAAVSHSEASSKDAIQALRRELVLRKQDSNTQVSRAIKLWACLYAFSSDRFKLQVASKKFLETLEEVYHGKHTSTGTQGRLLVAWSMIAHEASIDTDLQAIVRVFNKIKPSDMPLNGTPLNVEHDIFQIGDDFEPQYDAPSREVPDRQILLDANPGLRLEHAQGDIATGHNSTFSHTPLHSARAPNMQMNSSQQSSEQASLAPSVTSASNAAPAQNQSHGRQESFIPTAPSLLSSPPQDVFRQLQLDSAALREDQMRNEESLRLDSEREHRRAEIAQLHEECNLARGNAQLLRESLAESGIDGALVQEFGEKVRASQEFIAAKIPELSAKAEESRHVRTNEIATSGAASEAQSGETMEEMLIDDFLDAHEKLVTASSMLDEAETKRREDEEEARILERSMREMRMDRSTLVRDQETGHLYDVNNLPADMDVARLEPAEFSTSEDDPAKLRVPRVALATTNIAGASSSRSPSPQKRPLPEQPPTTAAGSLLGPGGPRDPHSHGRRGSRGPHPLPLPPRPHHAKGDSTDLSASAHGIMPPSGRMTQDDNEAIVTPMQPSEKALGKRRAISISDSQYKDAGEDGVDRGAVPVRSDYAAANNDEHADSPDTVLRTRPPPALPIL